MNINFVWVNTPPVEKNVTLQSFLMLKVKARPRHASTLKTKETRRFRTPANFFSFKGHAWDIIKVFKQQLRSK